jgi:hypothetical protein
MNFGGDKIWPAPQANWDTITPRSWPPPSGFDAAPYEASIDGWTVTLTSPVDPHYGIRTRRVIRLALDEPVMTVTTTFDKVAGQTLMTSVWAITQLKDPVLACAAVARPSMFRDGFKRQTNESPPSLLVQNDILRLTRDPKSPYKIGMDVPALVWIGEDSVLRIDSPRLPYREYPDEGSSAEIYTNPDPLRYVELEMLGPLTKMIIGSTTSRTSTYTLLRRAEHDPDLEARMLLKR